MKFFLTGNLLFWLVCGSNGLVAFAQSTTGQSQCRYSLHGRITDGDHGDELPGAVVYLKELQSGVATDQHGEYTIKGLCAGTYTIIFQFIGFESREMPITISGNTTLDLKLFHKTTNLETVVVVATQERTLSSLTTEEKTSRELDALKGGDLGDALRSISGVSTIQTGPTISKPVIRGMHSQRILTLNNGTRQEGQQWGAEHAPEIDPFAAGRIQVVKGAATVRYGPDAVAGVILVDAPPMRQTPGFGGHVYGVGISNGRQAITAVQAEGKPAGITNLSWRIQASGKNAGDLRAPDYFLTNTGRKELNGSAAVSWTTAKTETELHFSTFNTRLGIYAGAHIGNLTDLQQVLASGEPIVDLPFRYEIKPPYQEVQHHILSLKNSLSLPRLGKLSVQYSLQQNQRREYDRQRGDNPASELPADFDLRLNTQTGSIALDHKALGPVKGTIGLTTMLQTNRIGGRRFLIPDYDVYTGGLFLIEQLPFRDFLFEAGVRADVRKQTVYGQRANTSQFMDPVEFDFMRFSGTAGASYSPGHHWSYQLNAGTAWRAPSINEQFSNGVHHGAAAFEIGNEELKAETSYSLTAAINYTSPKADFSLQPFAQFIQGYIYARPLPNPVLTIRGAFPAFAFSQSDAFFMGIDFSGSYQLGHNYRLETSAAYVQAKNITGNAYFPLIPPGRMSNKLVRSFATKGILSEANLAVGNLTVYRQTRYQEASDFLPPPATYTLLQAEASATITLNQKPIWVQFAVNNALNTRYRDYLNRFRYFADETGRTFSVRVKIPFGNTGA